MPTNNIEIVEVMKAESALTGVMAGVAFTGVVLLVERVSAKRGTVKDVLGEGALAMFIAAFLIGLEASYLFAVGTSQSKDDLRTFAVFVFPAFLFVLTVFLMALGLVLLCEFYELNNTIDAIKGFQILILVFSVSEFSGTVIDARDTISPIGSNTIFASLDYWLFIGIGVASVLTTLVIRWIAGRRANEFFNKRGIRAFLFAVLIVAIVVGVCMSVVLDQNSDFQLPQWAGIVLVSAVAVLGGWSAIHVPIHGRKTKFNNTGRR